MGANNSTAPRIASMENPTVPETVILVSDEVASRIESTRQSQKTAQNASIQGTLTATLHPPAAPTEPYICKNCEKSKEEKKALKSQPPVSSLSVFEQKSQACAKEEFDRTLQMLEKAVGKPTDWIKEHKAEVKQLQTSLLQCYRDYPREPLQCHKHAKEYQDFVFEKQYKTILKQTLGAGDENGK